MVRLKKIYVVKMVSQAATETLTKKDIDRLIDGQYTDYFFPDRSLHSIIPVPELPNVVGRRLEPYTHNKGSAFEKIDWGWVAVMKKGWKPINTHPKKVEPEPEG